MLLKELQSLGLDVRVLREDNTEVEIMETVDMGETDFRSLIEGDRKYEDDNFGEQGYTEQEFQGDELIDIEEEEEPDEEYEIDFEETEDFSDDLSDIDY